MIFKLIFWCVALAVFWLATWVDTAEMRTGFDNVVNTVDNRFYGKIFAAILLSLGNNFNELIK